MANALLCVQSGTPLPDLGQPLAPNSDAEPLAATEVRVFRLSKDRRFLYFLQSGDASRLIQLNLATKEAKPLWTFADSLFAFDAWDVAASKLFYAGIELERSVPQPFSVDLDSGVRRVIGSIRMVSHERQTGLAASPDLSAVIAQVDTDDARAHAF